MYFGESFTKYFGVYNFGKDSDFFGIEPIASPFNSEVNINKESLG
jgi:hypothetical protein